MLQPHQIATLVFARMIPGMDYVTASQIVELSVFELGNVHKSKENLTKALQAVNALALRDKAAMEGVEF